MQPELPVLRGVEEAASSFARLDAAVAHSAPGLASILMLRSAQAIAALLAVPLDADGGGNRAGAFAALLGWWYAAESREFVADNLALRRCALALQATAEKVRGGRALTRALLAETVDVGIDASGAAPAAVPAADAAADFAADSEELEAMLRRSNLESWPALFLAAQLLSGECGEVPGPAAAIARAVAPLVGGLSADVFVVVSGAHDVVAALHGLATEARAMRRRIDGFRDQCTRAADRARGFGRGSGSALALLDLLAGTPAITVVGASGALGLTVPTVGAAVERLTGARLLREITGRGRDRVFVYEPAIALAG